MRHPMTGRRGAAAAHAALGLACWAAASPAGAEAPRTIGLVLGNWAFAMYETPNAKVECPSGYAFKQMDNYKAQYPSQEERTAHEKKFGYYVHRGPSGENAFYFPTLVDDPLPFRAAQGKTAFGLDLDGDAAGKGTAETAPHENFTSPDGKAGIDNQLYRVTGCISGLRSVGMIPAITSRYMTEAPARLLIEISDVDDEVNDESVTVTTYKGIDPVVFDGAQKPLPWLSQRIDYRVGDRYVHRMKGSIKDGVLTTEPLDLIVPTMGQPDMAGDRIFRKARWQLKLNPRGAEGLLAGYEDVERWYLLFAKTWGAHYSADVTGWSGPATYKAARQLADYKDPATGETTAISAAYQVGFARAFIIHAGEGKDAKPNRIASVK